MQNSLLQHNATWSKTSIVVDKQTNKQTKIFLDYCFKTIATKNVSAAGKANLQTRKNPHQNRHFFPHNVGLWNSLCTPPMYCCMIMHCYCVKCCKNIYSCKMSTAGKDCLQTRKNKTTPRLFPKTNWNSLQCIPLPLYCCMIVYCYSVQCCHTRAERPRIIARINP